MLEDHMIDPMDPSFFIGPNYHETLACLRAEAPVYEYSPGLWTISRYEDIRNVSRDPQRFCSGRGALVNDPIRGTDNPMAAPSILHMDPPSTRIFVVCSTVASLHVPWPRCPTPSARALAS